MVLIASLLFYDVTTHSATVASTGLQIVHVSHGKENKDYVSKAKTQNLFKFDDS